MKIWHTTVSAAIFIALLVCGMAWPYDESESAADSQAIEAELEDFDNPEESQENMMEDQYYVGEQYCNDNSLVATSSAGHTGLS